MKTGTRAVVLHVITRLDPGGSAENTVLSVERVDPSRYDSRILTGPGFSGTGPARSYVSRIRGRIILEPLLVRSIRPRSDMRAILALAHHFREIKPEILHLHSAKAGTLGRLAARKAQTDAKVIYTPHGHVFSGYGGRWAGRIFSQIEKSLVPFSDAVVGLTRDELHAFRIIGAGHPERFCVIPSGVELARYYRQPGARETFREELGIPKDGKVVGFVGRLDRVKGPDLFVDTAAEISRLMPDVSFIVVGDGVMRPDLEMRIVRSGLASRWRWLGWRQDTSQIYPAFDVLALTSRNEGQGRVLVEAMAAEVPTVAMASGGVPEVVVHGRTGFVVPGGSVKAAADAIVELLDNGELRAVMGAAGKQRAEERFTISLMIERLEKLYGGLLAGKTPAEIFTDRPG